MKMIINIIRIVLLYIISVSDDEVSQAKPRASPTQKEETKVENENPSFDDASPRTRSLAL
jgi:hypothetical protein